MSSTTTVKTITDLGATLAWSPLATSPNMIVTGTKEGGGGNYDDYGGDLALHRMDFTSPSQQCQTVGR